MMPRKSTSLIQLLFGDWLYLNSVKKAFASDEVYARTSYAFYEADTIEQVIFKRTFQKLQEIGGRDEYLEVCDINQFQMLATQTHALFLAFFMIYIKKLQFSKEKTDRITLIVTELNRQRWHPADNIKDYMNMDNITELSTLYGNDLAKIFDHKDVIIINDLSKITVDFYKLFEKKVEPAFKYSVEQLIKRIKSSL